MSLHSMISNGLSGVQTRQPIVAQARGRLAKIQICQDSTAIANSMVAMRAGEFQVKLGADVVRVADELMGRLINIKAKRIRFGQVADFELHFTRFLACEWSRG